MKKSTAYVLLYFATILTIAMLSSCSLHSIASENGKTDPCYYDHDGAIIPYNSEYRVTERYHFANPLKQD
jgi:hypothetical protein